MQSTTKRLKIGHYRTDQRTGRHGEVINVLPTAARLRDHDGQWLCPLGQLRVTQSSGGRLVMALAPCDPGDAELWLPAMVVSEGSKVVKFDDGNPVWGGCQTRVAKMRAIQ